MIGSCLSFPVGRKREAESPKYHYWIKFSIARQTVAPISWAETPSKRSRLLTEDKKNMQIRTSRPKNGNKGAALIMRQPCDNEAN